MKYIQYRYGLTEEQAREELEQINEEKMSNQEMFGFGGNKNTEEE